MAVERRRGSPPQSGTAWPLAAVVTYPPLSATSIYVCTFIPVSLNFFFAFHSLSSLEMTLLQLAPPLLTTLLSVYS